MNVINEKIELAPMKTLGFVQPCNKEKLPGDQYNIVHTMTEKNEEEQQYCLFQIKDDMYSINSNENKILKGLIKKYPSIFVNDDNPLSVTPFYYHTISLESTPKPRKPFPIPVYFHEKSKRTNKNNGKPWNDKTFKIIFSVTLGTSNKKKLEN